jgi:hypothetical protein
MGYWMTQRGDQDFTIKKENQEKALIAIKALSFEPTRSISGYSWVDDNYVNANTLKEALDIWRWEAMIDKDGDIIDLYFTGDKLGDEDFLFRAIAPYVEDGSYIEMSGEDSCLWRWCFENGTIFEKYPTITWE